MPPRPHFEPLPRKPSEISPVIIRPAAKPFRPGIVHFALAMGGFAIGTTEFATMSLLPFMAEGLSVDEPTAGHVISAYALGVVVGAPLIARRASR